MPDDAMLRGCEAVMRKACADSAAEPPEFNADTDHVHLRIEYPPEISVSALLNSLFGVSASPRPIHQLREPGQHARAVLGPAYLAASRGGAPSSITGQYIQQQQRPA